MPECTLPGCDRPTDPAAYACADCAAGLARALTAAADLVPELDTTLARQTRYGDPGPRPRNSAPAEPIHPDDGRLRHYADQVTGVATGLPYSEAASIVGGTVANTVDTWLRLVVAERFPGSAPAGPVCLECDHPTCERLHAWRRWMPPPADLAAAMRWLAGQVEWMRHQRWVADAVDELEHAAGLVARAVDRPAVRTRFKVGPCPEIAAGGVACGADVYAVVPAQQARPAVMRCESCGTEWPTMQWARAGRRILAQKSREP